MGYPAKQHSIIQQNGINQTSLNATFVLCQVIRCKYNELPGTNAFQGRERMGLQSRDLPLSEHTNQMHLLSMALPTPSYM